MSEWGLISMRYFAFYNAGVGSFFSHKEFTLPLHTGAFLWADSYFGC